MNQAARAHLFRLRQLGHNAFDRLWQGDGRIMQRKSAYTQLAVHLNIEEDQCHFAQFTAEQCHAAIAFSRSMLSRNRDVSLRPDHRKAKARRQRLAELADEESERHMNGDHDG
jgi:hypothetical protein